MYWRYSKKMRDFSQMITQANYSECPSIKSLNCLMAIKLIDSICSYDQEIYSYLINQHSTKERYIIFNATKKRLMKTNECEQTTDKFSLKEHVEAIEADDDLFIQTCNDHREILQLKLEEAKRDQASCRILKKLRQLQTHMRGVDDDTCTVLLFFVAAEFVSSNSKLYTDVWAINGSPSNINVLSELIGVPVTKLSSLLGERGWIFKTGIFEKIYRGQGYKISNFFVEFLNSENDITLVDNFFEEIMTENAKSVNSMKDEDIHRCRMLLNSKLPCVIGLYGEPGTGKTTTAKVLSKITNKKLYAIKANNEKGEESLSFRKMAMIVAQDVFDNSAIVLLDESDDILNFDQIKGLNDSSGKGFINLYLDSNKINLIFITNKSTGIPNSTKRRFNITVEYKKLDDKMRRDALLDLKNENEVDWLSNEVIELIADKYPLSPGIYHNSLSSALAISSESESPVDDFQYFLNSHAKFQNVRLKNKEDVDLSYEGLTTDIDLAQIEEKLSKFYNQPQNKRVIKSFTGLLDGPSGSGKSAAIKTLAKRLGKECHIISPHQIKSKWVGESERNLAKEIKSSADDGDIIVFEEIDTFVNSKRSDSPEHVTSLINEFLILLENTENLVLFGTTNSSVNEFEEAFYRRFNFKVAFDYMKHDKKVYFFKMYFPDYIVDEKVESELYALKYLTPGDFSNVYSQIFFDNLKSPLEVVKLLAKESNFKKQKRAKIGLYI